LEPPAKAGGFIISRGRSLTIGRPALTGWSVVIEIGLDTDDAEEFPRSGEWPGLTVVT
jgi:hypothetical protein